MNVLLSSEITPAMLISTNAPERLPGQTEWAAGAYVAGDTVTRTETRRVYRAAYAVPATIAAPEVDIATNQIPYWLDIGPMNQWGCCDSKMKTLTVGPDGESLVISLKPGIVTDIWIGALKFVSAVRVEVTNGEGGPVVYDQTRLLRKPVTTHWDWWFAPFADAADVAFTGIPAYRRARMTITLVTTGTASVGMIALGRAEVLGKTLWDVSTRHRNYTPSKQDDSWGPTGNPGGVVTRDQSYSVIVELEDAPRVTEFMSRAMNRLAVWLPHDADKFEGIRGIGQAISSDMDYSNGVFVLLEITVQGTV